MKPFFGIFLAALLFAGLDQLRPVSTTQATASPGDPNPESVRLIRSLEGRALYQAYCAVCHGSDARGAGPMAASLKVSPPDLTKIASGNHGLYPTTRIERIISGDVDLPGGHGTRAMPVWGPIFSQIAWDQDLGRMRVHNLAAYIGGLQAK